MTVTVIETASSANGSAATTGILNATCAMLRRHGTVRCDHPGGMRPTAIASETARSQILSSTASARGAGRMIATVSGNATASTGTGESANAIS